MIPVARMRNSLRSSEGGKHGNPVKKITLAKLEAQQTYRTQVWCAASRGTRGSADRDQSRATCAPGKFAPQTGDDPLDPHSPGHPSGLPPGAAAHTWGAMQQWDQGAAGPRKGAPVLPIMGCSETTKCGHTGIPLPSAAPKPSPKPVFQQSSFGASQQPAFASPGACAAGMFVCQPGRVLGAWQGLFARKTKASARRSPGPTAGWPLVVLWRARGERCGT